MVVAVNGSKLPAALAALSDFGGRIVVDADNSIEAPLFKPVDLGGRSSSEVFAGWAPGVRVVTAFNHFQPETVAGDPGIFGIDLGPLALGRGLVQFPGGPLPALNLVKLDEAHGLTAPEGNIP